MDVVHHSAVLRSARDFMSSNDVQRTELNNIILKQFRSMKLHVELLINILQHSKPS